MNSKLLKWTSAAVLACASSAWAEPQWLVTPDDMRQEAAWVRQNPGATQFRTRAFTPGSPEIVVVSPASLTEPLKAPFPIRVSFKPKEGAAVKPETFRALYGFMKIDITERLTGRAKVGAEGIHVESANIPAGSHRLFLRVSDDRDREAETEIRFTVQ
ncbi:MAG: hypothetical protein ACM3Y9_06710 [Ignavibacteria bacterium]